MGLNCCQAKFAGKILSFLLRSHDCFPRKEIQSCGLKPVYRSLNVLQTSLDSIAGLTQLVAIFQFTKLPKCLICALRTLCLFSKPINKILR